MLHDIVSCTQLEVLCLALSGDPSVRKTPGAVRFHFGVRVVPAKPHPTVIACGGSRRILPLLPHGSDDVFVVKAGLRKAGGGRKHLGAGVARY